MGGLKASERAAASGDSERFLQRYNVTKTLGDCYAQRGDHQRAEQCYRQAAELAERHPGPHLGLGALAMKKGLLDQARQAFEQAIKMDGVCSAAYAGLGQIYAQGQDYSQACQMYLKALATDRENLQAIEGLDDAARHSGQRHQAAAHLEAYLQNHPGNTSVLFRLAEIYAEQGRLKEATQLLRTSTALDPEHAEGQALLKKLSARLAASCSEESAP